MSIYIAFDARPYVPDRGDHVYRYANGEVIRVSVLELTGLRETIFTHDKSMLIQMFRRLRAPLPQNLIDIGDKARLALGSKTFSKRYRETTVKLAALVERFSENGFDRELDFLISTSNNGRSRHLKRLSKYLLDLNEKVDEILEKEGEVERWSEVERPVTQLLALQEYRGIRINEDLAERYLAEIDQDRRQFERKLRKEFGLADPNYKLEVARSFEMHGFRDLSGVVGSANIESVLKFSTRKDTLPAVYSQWRKLGKSKDIILKLLAGSDGRVFPKFDALGTITGRILVSEPALQNLSSVFRGILLSQPESHYLYPDYVAFEPSILLSIEKRMELRVQSPSRLYERAAESVFGSEKYRDEAKAVVMSLMYGMSDRKVAELASEMAGKRQLSHIYQAVRKIKEDALVLGSVRKKIGEEIFENSSVKTQFGGHRVLSSVGSEKSISIGLAHKIQGTASLIAKKAMLNCSRDAPELEPVLPMHDAVLYCLPHPDPKYSAVVKEAFRCAADDVLGKKHYVRVKLGRFLKSNK